MGNQNQRINNHISPVVNATRIQIADIKMETYPECEEALSNLRSELNDDIKAIISRERLILQFCRTLPDVTDKSCIKTLDKYQFFESLHTGRFVYDHYTIACLNEYLSQGISGIMPVINATTDIHSWYNLLVHIKYIKGFKVSVSEDIDKRKGDIQSITLEIEQSLSKFAHVTGSKSELIPKIREINTLFGLPEIPVAPDPPALA